MAFKGTARRSARKIAEDIENVGGEINAATTVESTNYTARVLGEDIEVALDVLGDILNNSAFDEAELAREKGVILQEYAAVEDTPDDLRLRRLHGGGVFRPAHRPPILGRPETITSFDGGMIRAFMAREYTPDRMVLAAAGAVAHEAVVEAAERHFRAVPGLHPAPPFAPAAYTGGERRMRRKLEQANLVIGLPGVSFKHEAYYATHLFAQILGGGLTSRLWHEVRETRGLAYDIGAFHWPFSDAGLFGISAGTSGSDVAQLVEVTLDCAREAAAALDEAELSRAKTQLKVALLTVLKRRAVGSSATPASCSPGAASSRARRSLRASTP
jgi:predicted Zn-dependent peptidase